MAVTVIITVQVPTVLAVLAGVPPQLSVAVVLASAALSAAATVG